MNGTCVGKRQRRWILAKILNRILDHEQVVFVLGEIGVGFGRQHREGVRELFGVLLIPIVVWVIVVVVSARAFASSGGRFLVSHLLPPGQLVNRPLQFISPLCQRTALQFATLVGFLKKGMLPF